MNRRSFLGSTAAGALGLAASVRAVRAASVANNRLNFLAIGVRSRGAAISVGSCKFGRVAACADVDRSLFDPYFAHLGRSQKERPDIYSDYREALARDDIDAVTIGTPDHWHARMIIDAIRAGKDVYVEKPMTLTAAEGQAVCRAIRAGSSVVQVGTQQRTEYGGAFARAAALARLGYAGPRITATILLPARYGKKDGPFPFVPVPEGLDWDRWLGPAPQSEYCPERCHGSWRMWVETGCGPLTDWGVHHLDIAVWAIDPDFESPVEVSGSGEFPLGREATQDALLGRRPFSSLPNAFSTVRNYEATIRFAGGHEIRIDGLGREPGPGREANGLELVGERGTVWTSRLGRNSILRGSAVDAAAKDGKKVMDEVARLFKGRAPRWMEPER